MKFFKTIIATFLVFAFTLIAFVALSYPQSQQVTLNQYVSDLQKNPNDNALREKIIRHVQGMKQKPSIPEEAREHYVMAVTFVEKAKDNSGYERAIEQYKAALLTAPWWADAYKKQAIVQKATARYDDAITSLNLYILTQPADVRDAQDEIYKLKALKLSATEDQLKKQREEQKREAPKVFLQQLKQKYNGATYNHEQCSHANQSGCFKEVGSWPCGCNEAEYRGNNWYKGDTSFGFPFISFPSDGTILFMYGSSIWLRGTPKGATMQDIVWEQRKGNEWIQVWVELLDGLDRFVFNADVLQFTGRVRHIDNALYNPNERYNYILFKKR
jgi:hypothetical protein